MRIAAAGRVLCAACLAVCVFLVGAAPVLGAEPAATPGAGGDPRSPGEGPGLVGDPGFALAMVVLVAILSVAGTLAYVRLTSRGSGSRPG